ncbi:MAG: efflux RND transporter periplasmic adaptor subunit, partial [Candidatus Obscuribacterales bacterium]|nr:efflux RND transporter periplasmic adaptor subunit [Candidatus Obscuribacterales bacterium]
MVILNRDKLDWRLFFAIALIFAVSANAPLAAHESSSGSLSESYQGHESTGPTRDLVKLSKRAIEAIGLQLVTVKKSPLPLEIVTMGKIEAMPTKSYTQHALLSGRVHEVDVEPGDMVRAGQILTVLDSPEINRLAAETLNSKNMIEAEIKTKKSNYASEHRQCKAKVDLARANHERQTTLFKEKIGSKKELDMATAELSVAESQLENTITRQAVETAALEIKLKVTIRSLIDRMKQVGVSDETIKKMLISENAILKVPVRSTRSGVVTEVR